MRYIFAATIGILAASSAFASDVVTMPSANQLKPGAVEAAGYYFYLDNPSLAPQYSQVQTLYVGLTDRWELDVTRSSVDKDETGASLAAYYKVLNEDPKTPDLVIGSNNLTNQALTFDNPLTAVDERGKSKDRSYFVAAAKTFFFNPAKPGAPLVRTHLGLGTQDWTVMAKKRHEGLFGGLEFLLRPELGLVVENDGTDTITCIAIMPKNSGLTLKGGTYGDHTWVGIAYKTAFSK